MTSEENIEVEVDEFTPIQVNEYKVSKLLGSGAFGDVRLGENEKGDKFAVKCLSRSFLKRKREFSRQKNGRMKVTTALDDVMREIAIMKKTKHANLVSLVEVVDDEENDMLYMVLEFVPGGQVMYWNGQLRRYSVTRQDTTEVYEEDKAKALMRDAVAGLRYLHAQTIIHRDLKPENMLLGVDGRLKIADFGIAQKLDMEKKKSISITTMQGTHQFMSPEMITEEKYNGYMVDVWALGICLYVFITGELPFWGNTVDEIFQVVTTKPLSVPESLSPELKSLLTKVLEKDPSKRCSLDQFGADPWVGMDIDTVQVVEISEEEKLAAITEINLDFVKITKLKMKAKAWKKKAASSKLLQAQASNNSLEDGNPAIPKTTSASQITEVVIETGDVPAVKDKPVSPSAAAPAVSPPASKAASTTTPPQSEPSSTATSSSTAKPAQPPQNSCCNLL